MSRVPRRLTVTLPDALAAQLEQRARQEGASVEHVVRRILGDELDLEQHSLFQVSTSGALVEGVTDGCLTVADLLHYGDFGLGTFDGLDGELVLLDGRCYRARGDGDVTTPDPAALTPFAVVTRFVSDRVLPGVHVRTWAALEVFLDHERASENHFLGIRATGRFDTLHLRAACRTEHGVPLVDAVAHQAEWELTGVDGTLVGFWSPPFARAVAVPGLHLHVVSDDGTQAGHVLGISAADLTVELHELNDVHLALPESEAFVHADLSRDPSADLDRAEHAQA